MTKMNSNNNILSRVTGFIKDLLSKGSVRKLELRKPDGTRVFSIGVTWAVVIALAAFLTNTLFIIAIASVVLIVMKYQIAVVKEV